MRHLCIAKRQRVAATLMLALQAGVLAAVVAVPSRASAQAPPPAGPSVSPTAPAPRPTIARPSRTKGATLAGIVAATAVRSDPGTGRRIWTAATATSWSRQPQVLLVLGSARVDDREWLQVLLPIRPNGTSGWIPRDNAVLSTTRYWITVNKRARTVTVYRRGRLLHRFGAVIGKPATPTPDGLAAIYEIDPQPDPHAFLGPWALPLTIFSNVLKNFGGGPGRVAIHGRDGASLGDPLGSARSHGCIRIRNRAIRWMAAHLEQGTPVDITH